MEEIPCTVGLQGLAQPVEHLLEPLVLVLYHYQDTVDSTCSPAVLRLSGRGGGKSQIMHLMPRGCNPINLIWIVNI